MRFILAPIVIVIGIMMMRYSVKVTDWTGHLDWAEEYLGGGGTYLWWKLVGLFFVILACLWLLGFLNIMSSPGNVGP